MPCYHQLDAWYGPTNPSGKRSIVFNPGASVTGVNSLKINCGQCLGCRLDYSLKWATRCLHESQMHKQNCFITLTYNNLNLPKMGSLIERDFQLFMKRFRKEIKCPIKYYMA